MSWIITIIYCRISGKVIAEGIFREISWEVFCRLSDGGIFSELLHKHFLRFALDNPWINFGWSNIQQRIITIGRIIQKFLRQFCKNFRQFCFVLYDRLLSAKLLLRLTLCLAGFRPMIPRGWENKAEIWGKTVREYPSLWSNFQRKCWSNQRRTAERILGKPFQKFSEGAHERIPESVLEKNLG